MKAKDMRYRLTGLTVGTVGASWERIETEKDEAQKIITFLEDRRVLYGPFDLEIRDHCIRSVLEIRSFLTGERQNLQPRLKLAQTLRGMRANARRFLDVSQAKGGPSQIEFLTALGEVGLSLAFT
jgi:hypothetical protein